MARVLEPLLWRRFTHLQAGSGVLENEDIDLDLAASEGLMVMGLDFNIHSEFTAAVTDFNAVVIARPNAEDVVSTIVEAQADSDFIAGYHVNSDIDVEGAFVAEHHRDWRAPGEGAGEGLVIARRMTYLQDCSLQNALMSLTVWYKRILFTDSEMIGLLIRRR